MLNLVVRRETARLLKVKLDVRLGLMANATTRPLYPPEGATVSTVQKVG
jgi:hypothetical protein